jgi:predicted DNA-binding transcriptional regulator YafY
MTKSHDTGVRILAIERMLASGRKMKLKEIQQELAQKYEIYAHRDTIRGDIYTLNLFMPIESTSGNNGGYQRVDVLARCKD